MSTQTPKKKKTGWKTFWRIARRTLLVLVTIVLAVAIAAVLFLNAIFNGPSESARNTLTMSMLESSGMKWFPGLFIGQDTVNQIANGGSEEFEELPDSISDNSLIKIDSTSSLGGNTDEWKDHPDGIRIEEFAGATYTAHIMIIRDPSQVYMATSPLPFSETTDGLRINQAMEQEGAIAAINGGSFIDNKSSGIPQGLVISKGDVVWNQGRFNPNSTATENLDGFVGFNQDNILVVAEKMTKSQSQELGIRDGCGFGPVLILNGQVNERAYNANSGYNPRTAIGQRADGAIIFLCIDGRQAGSLGGSYRDIIDIMVKYGAVNACNLDGGSSTLMLYRDTYGLYGEAGEVQMINNYSLLQEQPRKMPTFFMVRPAESSKEG